LVSSSPSGDGGIERYAYDPWGARRNPDDWTKTDARTSWITHRGYTGHEHIDAFGVINMNGRVYDPMTAIFFSPDPLVQSTGDWMNYNRYTYCLNNPFRYTDPSGNFFIVDDVVVDAMIIAAIISAVAYTASVALSPGGFTNWNFCRLGLATGEGAIAGACTAGIGDLFGAVGGAGGELADAGINLGSVGNELARAAVHGLSNGLLNSAFGGDFAQGFASGALGSLGGSAFQAFGGEAAKSFIGTVAFSSVSGGLGSVLSGGDFWKGAAIGAIVGALNHMNELQKGDETPWMTVAENERGVKEDGVNRGQDVEKYQKSTGNKPGDSWCSSFVNWTLEQVGIKGTDSGSSLSWLKWGSPLNEPAYGSIGIHINPDGKTGHVGFVAGENSNNKIVLLGGNQHDMVNYTAFPKSYFSKFVYPSGYNPNYNLLIMYINNSANYRQTR
jgi:uncharacterized protein (TIGR02594 family)